MWKMPPGARPGDEVRVPDGSSRLRYAKPTACACPDAAMPATEAAAEDLFEDDDVSETRNDYDPYPFDVVACASCGATVVTSHLAVSEGDWVGIATGGLDQVLFPAQAVVGLLTHERLRDLQANGVR